MAHDSSVQPPPLQRISRLTPLRAILAAIDAQMAAAAPQRRTPAAALNATLAQDVTAATLPPQATALRDGYAVDATAIADASAYAPIALASLPRRVDTGEALPPGTDSVALLDAIVFRGGRAEAVLSLTPGDGVLPVGGDIAHVPLLRAGSRLRALDIAVLNAAGVAEISVRVPRLRLAFGGATQAPPLAAAQTLLAELIVQAGAAIVGETIPLAQALADETADAVIAIGGTGSGRNDAAVLTVAQRGQLVAHGIAVSPGETAAFGFVGKRPALLIPGRLDAVLAVWFLIGQPLVAKLAGATVENVKSVLSLKRKVTSTIGLTEMIPVRVDDGMVDGVEGGVAEPLGSGYLSLSMLAESDGYIVVPAESEGFAAGTRVAVRSWF